MLDKYCVTCHNQRLRTAGLTLDTMNLDRVGDKAETWEKVLRKLHGGMMPPQGMPRPDEATVNQFTGWLETSIDRAAASHPEPGRSTLHRLNRTEYGNAIHDLLDLDIDATSYLPADDEANGFDNIADVLALLAVAAGPVPVRIATRSRAWRWAIRPSLPSAWCFRLRRISTRSSTSRVCLWARAAASRSTTTFRWTANTTSAFFCCRTSSATCPVSSMRTSLRSASTASACFWRRWAARKTTRCRTPTWASPRTPSTRGCGRASRSRPGPGPWS